MALRDKILSMDDRPLEELPIPEWGESVYLRPPTAGQVRKWFDLVKDADKDEHTIARIAVLFALEKDGKPAFSEDDVSALSSKNNKPLQRIAVAVAKLVNASVDTDVLEKKIQG